MRRSNSTKGQDRVAFVHWNEAEARLRVATTRFDKFRLEWLALQNGSDRRAWKSFRDDPPAAVLIDLSRLPSHGREVALALRQTKATARLPIVFVGGEPAKVEATRAKLVDAVFCDWSDCEAALARAIRAPAPAPLPRDASCSTSSLPTKLGIRESSKVLLAGAPDDFAATLGALPDGATAATVGRGPFDVIVVFLKAKNALVPAIKTNEARLARGGGLWIAWPKKASRVATDVTEDVIRAVALSQGMVDNKVCAIDATWSGLRLARRRK